MAQKNAKIDLKIVLVGAAAVGKTSLIHRYMNNDFGNTSATIGASFALKAWKEFKFGIWDTAGQEKYASLSSFYCRNAGAALVCYDIMDKDTFTELDKYVDFLKEGANQGCYIILVGTKLDLEEDQNKKRQVSKLEAQTYADKIGAMHYETSAKSGYNVSEVFDRIGTHVFGVKAGSPSKDPRKPASTSSASSSSSSSGKEGVVDLEEKPKDTGGCSC